jgi:hypothetical protein
LRISAIFVFILIAIAVSGCLSGEKPPSDLFYLNTPQLAAVGINSQSNFKRENIMKSDGRIKACKPLCLQNKIPHGAMCEV